MSEQKDDKPTKINPQDVPAKLKDTHIRTEKGVRFKKGVSGNPAGRKKGRKEGSKNKATLERTMKEALEAVQLDPAWELARMIQNDELTPISKAKALLGLCKYVCQRRSKTRPKGGAKLDHLM